MLVLLGLCNPQGVKYFSFVNVPVHVLHSIASSQTYLTHTELLHVVGCRFKSNIIKLLSLSTDVHREPNRNACHKYMYMIARRIASKLMTDVRDKFAKEAEELCALGQCVAAIVPLQWAIYFEHLPSRALLAYLLIDGREGIAKDKNRGFELVEEGARLGCHHCKGMLAYSYLYGYGCKRDNARSLKLARKSSGLGSKYGQYILGEWQYINGQVPQDMAQAVAFFRLAAAQGLDNALFKLGYMYNYGINVTKNYSEALRLYQLSAAQGNSTAFFKIAMCYEKGWGVAVNIIEAIRWYSRAQAAGHR
jgi:TPR repeat protein